MTKKLLCDFAAPEIDRELELAIAESARIRSTPDFREGLASFLEKRAAALDRKITVAQASACGFRQRKLTLARENSFRAASVFADRLQPEARANLLQFPSR